MFKNKISSVNKIRFFNFQIDVARLVCFLLASCLTLCLPPSIYAQTSNAAPIEAVNPALETPIDFQTAPEIQQFIDDMVVRNAFNADELRQIFNRAKYSSKAVQLVKPAPSNKPKNWQAYRARFIDKTRIKAGVAFWNTYAQALDKAEQQYGVPAEIIVGIIGVETVFGKNVGNFRVIDVLSTLAFAYPDVPNKTARMTYFKSELEQSLLYAREMGLDPFSLLGSYAGAIGWPQFMPSSIRRYGVDFNDDGKIDLRNKPEDAIGSVAHYLQQHGWVKEGFLAYPAILQTSTPDTFVSKELVPSYTLQELATIIDVNQIPLNTNKQSLQNSSQLYGFIDLQNGEQPTEYWVVSDNFFAITRYNRSYFYAMSVIDLGRAICRAKSTKHVCK